MLGIHGLHASLSLLLEVGMDEIANQILNHAAHLIALIDGQGLELLSPRTPERRAGIVTFRVPGSDPAAAQRYLMSRNLVCAARGGGIRFSPHFYTPAEKLERAFEILAELG
jgi:selenocysteine lyase/cysteine desulfurase